MEKRAVQVSHEMWKQTMTQGHASGGLRCIKGIPEDATLHLVTLTRLGGKPDAVLVFESDSWKEAAGSRTIQIAGQEFPLFVPMFRIAECRTCKWWSPNALSTKGECVLTRVDDFVAAYDEASARTACGCDSPHPISWLMTNPDFGCTQYELRETND